MLPLRRFGEGSPIVALHGFTYTGRQFAGLAERLGRSVVAPDLPGHGGASHATTAWPTVLDMVASVTADQTGPLLGYSQGARLALAGTATGTLDPSALVLISGTAGINDDEARRSRAEHDRVLAVRILELGLDAFLEEWTTTGITSTQGLSLDERDADIAIRRENTAEGLASALIGYGQAALEPVWDSLTSVNAPTLLVAGAADEKYREIAHELERRIPHAQTVIIDGSGHNPMLTHPLETAAAVSGFLDGLS